MRDRANILWPAAIIGLLLLSAVTTFGVLIASRSDGGAQVVNNYYRKSVAWDSLAEAHRSSRDLGWSVAVRIDLQSSPTVAVATFSDSLGSPLPDLAGSVTVSRPHSAVVYGTHALTADGGAPGSYQFLFPYAERGLWDLNIVAESGAGRFLERVRIEI